ncbi:unnamed protein product [Caretta caretta]
MQASHISLTKAADKLPPPRDWPLPSPPAGCILTPPSRGTTVKKHRKSCLLTKLLTMDMNTLFSLLVR